MSRPGCGDDKGTALLPDNEDRPILSEQLEGASSWGGTKPRKPTKAQELAAARQRLTTLPLYLLLLDVFGSRQARL